MRLAPSRRARILDFDCECRPLSWYGGDWVSKEVTAIAWGWVSPRNSAKVTGRVECRLLGAGDLAESAVDVQLRAIVEEFREAYDAADVVTGHYIRGFDLPLLNGAALDLGLAPLAPKLTHDTKGDLIRFQGLSKSQESIGAMLGLKHPKVGMSQDDWRSANRLTADGMERTRRRVVGDVRQHVEMRAALLDRGMLTPPRRWDGGSKVAGSYQP